MLFLYILLTVATAVSISAGTESCDNSDAALLNCATHLADADHDNRLNRAEIDYAISNTLIYPAGITTDFVMHMDYNQDGYLDMTDWNNSTRRFYKDSVTQTMACFFCRQNGVAMNINKKRNSEEQERAFVCDTSDDKLIHCVLSLFDKNGDKIITLAELQSGFKELSFTYGITPATMMHYGDTNKDGVLTRAEDWDTPSRKIMKTEEEKQLACTFCQKNHVSMIK